MSVTECAYLPQHESPGVAHPTGDGAEPVLEVVCGGIVAILVALRLEKVAHQNIIIVPRFERTLQRSTHEGLVAQGGWRGRRGKARGRARGKPVPGLLAGPNPPITSFNIDFKYTQQKGMKTC